MQEEVEDRTVNLAVSTSKLAGKEVIAAAQAALKALETEAEKTPTGKQTVKQLIGQERGVTTIDISKTDLKGFEQYARKYGVDYAITKDTSSKPSHYLVFFKGQDQDAITAAFNEYTAKELQKNKKERPSIRQELSQIMEKARNTQSRVREKHQEIER